jgi:hypothetical protein
MVLRRTIWFKHEPAKAWWFFRDVGFTKPRFVVAANPLYDLLLLHHDESDRDVQFLR